MISHTLETPPPKPKQTVREAPARAPARPAPKHRTWLWVLVWCAVGAVVYFNYPRILPWLRLFEGKAADQTARPMQRTVPVVTATAHKGDMALYLNGLGTVNAFNTVTIRSRVDGELVKVLFTEGEMVRQNQFLAEIDPRPYQLQLADAQAALARDEAMLKNARLVLARDKTLVRSNSVTQQEYEAQTASVDQAAAIVQSDQAKIDNVKLQLVYCHITAPISGRIGLRGVDQGNMVHANDPNGLAVITQLQPISVVFTIPQDDIPRVQRSLSTGLPLVVDAYDRDFKTRLSTGSLSAIDNQVDPSTGTLRLKAVFDNKQNELFPNQFVNARLLVDTKAEATLIPTAAVQRGPSSTFVYVVKPDETVEMRNIVIGPNEGDQTIVERGVSPGDVVVTDGLDKLQPGSKVAVRGQSSSGRAASEDAAVTSGGKESS